MLSLFFANFRAMLARTMQEEDGQGLSEYALILALVALACILALTLLGGNIASILSSVANKL
jgi:pilus assembly protein Flp/PilA